ncbi:MAG: hypothetical protein KKC20_10305 [Proteobacteria bacterium]|nr:hypothetical protein [Pseudomonadota bacterium]
MQRRINLCDKPYLVTRIGPPRTQQLKVDDGQFQPVRLTSMKNGQAMIQLGGSRVHVQMAVKGETVYIRAFNQTFALDILNPVEQAARGNFEGNTCRAPMPGTVVTVDVEAGTRVMEGQSMMTIESMKILTNICAPREGEVARVHFEPGSTFGKNAALITLTKKETV